jgi:hypothetical protein
MSDQNVSRLVVGESTGKQLTKELSCLMSAGYFVPNYWPLLSNL